MSSGRALFRCPLRMMRGKAVADADHAECPTRHARMVAAPITLLMPGAGPPPTKMPTLGFSVMYAAGYTRICDEKSPRDVTTRRVGSPVISGFDA